MSRTYLPVYLAIYRSIYLYIYLYIYLFIYIYIYLSISHLSIYLSIESILAEPCAVIAYLNFSILTHLEAKQLNNERSVSATLPPYLRYPTAVYSTVLHFTLLYSTVRSNPLLYSSLLYSTSLCSLLLFYYISFWRIVASSSCLSSLHQEFWISCSNLPFLFV